MYENEILQEVTADTYDKCKEKLYMLYGDGYEIRDRRITSTHGFLGLHKKEQVVVKFIVRERNKPADPANFLWRQAQSQKDEEEEQKWKDNQQAILSAQTSTLISAQVSKMDEVQDRISQMEESINRKLAALGNSEKHESISKIEELLSQNEFSFSFIQMITDKIRQTFSLDQLNDFNLVERTVVDWIGETIVPAEEHHVRPPHVVILVGPTGVGKTTTLVKLFAQEIIRTKNTDHPSDVRLISTDGTRVGAYEQLERFGEIFSKEVLKAESQEDVAHLFNQYKNHCDSIYIDTSGYSPNDSTHIGSMKAMLDVPGLSPDVYLAFDAKTKYRDIINIMNNYEPFSYGSVIVTKCDESNQYGNIISALYEKHKKIAYVTDGQNAARNISRADVIYFLTRLEGFNVDRNHINKKFLNSEEN